MKNIKKNTTHTHTHTHTHTTKYSYNINEHIKKDKIRLIGLDGKHLGIFTLIEALKYAKEENSDLVEIQPYSDPSVCQIMDFKKFLYKKKKKDKKNSKNKRNYPPKEIKIKPNIEKADYERKIKNIINFLKKNKIVNISVLLRGNKELGFKIKDKITKEIQALNIVSSYTKKIETKKIHIFMYPKINKIKTNEGNKINEDKK